MRLLRRFRRVAEAHTPATPWLQTTLLSPAPISQHNVAIPSRMVIASPPHLAMRLCALFARTRRPWRYVQVA